MNFKNKYFKYKIKYLESNNDVKYKMIKEYNIIIPLTLNKTISIIRDEYLKYLLSNDVPIHKYNSIPNTIQIEYSITIITEYFETTITKDSPEQIVIDIPYVIEIPTISKTQILIPNDIFEEYKVDNTDNNYIKIKSDYNSESFTVRNKISIKLNNKDNLLENNIICIKKQKIKYNIKKLIDYNIYIRYILNYISKYDKNQSKINILPILITDPEQITDMQYIPTTLLENPIPEIPLKSLISFDTEIKISFDINIEKKLLNNSYGNTLFTTNIDESIPIITMPTSEIGKMPDDTIPLPIALPTSEIRKIPDNLPIMLTSNIPDDIESIQYDISQLETDYYDENALQVIKYITINDKKLFELCNNLIRLLNKQIKSNKSIIKCQLAPPNLFKIYNHNLTSGSFGSIYTSSNKMYENKVLKQIELNKMDRELLLYTILFYNIQTIYNLIPEIFSIYISDTHLYIEMFKYESNLAEFFTKEKIDNIYKEVIISKLNELFSNLFDLTLICLDIKPENIVINYTNNRSDIRFIDIEPDFCLCSDKNYLDNPINKILYIHFNIQYLNLLLNNKIFQIKYFNFDFLFEYLLSIRLYNNNNNNIFYLFYRDFYKINENIVIDDKTILEYYKEFQNSNDIYIILKILNKININFIHIYKLYLFINKYLFNSKIDIQIIQFILNCIFICIFFKTNNIIIYFIQALITIVFNNKFDDIYNLIFNSRESELFIDTGNTNMNHNELKDYLSK